jgi:general secretion pathway protein H
MRTSATGTSINSGRPRTRGFTLIEILVVVFIIGLVSAGAILAFTSEKRDTQLENESERMEALFAYVREQAELQTRDYGLRIDRLGYSFVVFDVLADQWRPVDEDDAMRQRNFPEGIQPEVVVEGRQIVLDTKKKSIEDYSPDILVFANGDVSSFEVTLRREGGDAAKLYTDDDSHIVLLQPGETPPPKVVKKTLGATR